MRIDGRGRWLMPGLYDLHVHLEEDEELLFYLANGVTTVLNLSGSPEKLELRAATRPFAVVAAGRWLAREELDRELAQIEASFVDLEAQLAEIDPVLESGTPSAWIFALRALDEPSQEIVGFVESEINQERYAEQGAENLELRVIEGPPSAAVIRIGGFFGDDYEQFLADAFGQIDEQGIEHLILDLRDNGGGRDMYGSMLFSYLTDEPFAYYESLQINGPELEIMRYSQNPSYSVPEEEFEQRDGGYFLTPLAHDNLKIQQPRGPRFGGKVYALISGASFSATSEFLAVLYQNREATYIGEESGGGQYGNTSGDTAVITLPHTKMRLNVPLNRYNSAVEGYEPTDRGMIPNHEVHLTQEDLVDGSDSVLEFALELIRRSGR